MCNLSIVDLEPYIDPEHDPAYLAAHPGLSAEDRGWVRDSDDLLELRRQRADRRLTTVETQVQVLKMYHRGIEAVDIGEALGLDPWRVTFMIKGAQKRSLRYVGAQHERERQIFYTDAMLDKLSERMFPDANDDGWTPPADLKAAETILKVLKRRAELTGADMPSKLVIDGELQINPGNELVEKVSEYMDLADALINMGYGSGRAIDGDGEDIIDAEVLDARALPPPAPPVSPFHNDLVPDPGDLVQQSDPQPHPLRPVVDLDEDPTVRALRLPVRHPDERVRKIDWSIPPADD